MSTSGKYQNPYFDFIILDDDIRLLHRSFALRYAVYCEEQHFLPAAHYPHKEETDEFDPYSTHIGAVYLKDGNVIGTLRVVPSRSGVLPMDKHCIYQEKFFHSLGFQCPAELLHQPTTVEISRFVVSARFCRRVNDGRYALSEDAQRRPVVMLPGGVERRNKQPVISLGIIKTLYQFSKRNGIRYWAAAMEDALIRHLAKWHMVFQPLGPKVDYYGPVAPYILEVADIDRRMSQQRPRLMEEWLDGLEPEYTSWFPGCGNHRNENLR